MSKSKKSASKTLDKYALVNLFKTDKSLMDEIHGAEYMDLFNWVSDAWPEYSGAEFDELIKYLQDPETRCNCEDCASMRM